MTLRTEYVHHPPSGWTEYSGSHRERRWLVSESAASFWTSFLGVYLALATARAFPVLKRALLVILPHEPAAEAPEQTELPTRPLSVRHEVELAHSVEGAGSRLIVMALRQVRPNANALPGSQPRVVTLSSYWGDLRGHIEQNSVQISWASVLGLLLLGLYFGFASISIYSNVIISSSVALSNSPDCGVTQMSDQSGLSSQVGWLQYLHNVESESGQYAKTCYSSDSGPEDCSFFYNRSIHYSVRTNEPCPFEDLCIGGSSSAFSADTGLIPAETIGINSPLKYHFRRFSTCAPLRTDLGKYSWADVNNETWYYFYGANSMPITKCPDHLVNCTWAMPWLPSNLNKPSYQAFVVSYSDFVNRHSLLQHWEPLPALRPMANSSVILIAIQNSLVHYDSRRDDPVFPADANVGGADYTWYNSLFTAGIIGCRDYAYICEPNNGTCHNALAAPDVSPSDGDTQVVITMLSIALAKSTLSYSMGFRLQDALDCQSKLAQDRSLPLAEEQWTVEVRRLFETSLARAQIEMRNLARGIGTTLPGSYNNLDREPFKAIKGRMCNSYKFQSTGWKNINVKWFVVSLLGGLFVVIVGYEVEELLVEIVFKRLKSWLRSIDWRGLLKNAPAIGWVILSFIGTVARTSRSLFMWLIGDLIKPRLGKEWGDFKKVMKKEWTEFKDWCRKQRDEAHKAMTEYFTSKSFGIPMRRRRIIPSSS